MIGNLNWEKIGNSIFHRIRLNRYHNIQYGIKGDIVIELLEKIMKSNKFKII